MEAHSVSVFDMKPAPFLISSTSFPVTERNVLTTASCLVGKFKEYFSILVGYGTTSRKVYEIGEIVRHERFNLDPRRNDIAIVRPKLVMEMSANVGVACFFLNATNLHKPIGVNVQQVTKIGYQYNPGTVDVTSANCKSWVDVCTKTTAPIRGCDVCEVLRDLPCILTRRFSALTRKCSCV